MPEVVAQLTAPNGERVRVLQYSVPEIDARGALSAAFASFLDVEISTAQAGMGEEVWISAAFTHASREPYGRIPQGHPLLAIVWALAEEVDRLKLLARAQVEDLASRAMDVAAILKRDGDGGLDLVDDLKAQARGLCLCILREFAPLMKPRPGVFEQELVPEPPAVRTCRVCGCTDLDCSAWVERTGVACFWVEADLCSACEQSALLWTERLERAGISILPLHCGISRGPDDWSRVERPDGTPVFEFAHVVPLKLVNCYACDQIHEVPSCPAF